MVWDHGIVWVGIIELFGNMEWFGLVSWKDLGWEKICLVPAPLQKHCRGGDAPKICTQSPGGAGRAVPTVPELSSGHQTAERGSPEGNSVPTTRVQSQEFVWNSSSAFREQQLLGLGFLQRMCSALISGVTAQALLPWGLQLGNWDLGQKWGFWLKGILHGKGLSLSTHLG